MKTVGDPMKEPMVNLANKLEIPPKPTLPKIQGDTSGVQIVSSEMESDNYHHISEQLSQATEKININKLVLELQDKDRQLSRMSESNEDGIQPQVYPYDDGEVKLKTIMSPGSSTGGSKTSSVDQYLTPKSLVVNPILSCKESSSSNHREHMKISETEVGQWTRASVLSNGKYYSHEGRDPKCMKLIETAIVYHPPSRTFVRVKDKKAGIIARMLITLDQLANFKTFPCYLYYDPIIESNINDELAWDSFQTLHSEINPTYETPHHDVKDQVTETDEQEPKMNSFRNLVDLMKYTDRPKELELSVEHLLDTKTRLQEQLKNSSNESIREEGNHPKTLGEHQMPYLMGLKSIRDVQLGKVDPGYRQHVYSSDEGRKPPLRTENDDDPFDSMGERNPSRFGHVECLKEYLQSNIQILQEQIEWNDRMKQVEMQLREQGTTMTPIMKVNHGTSMNETTVEKSLPEALYCLHCTEWGHDIYQCQVPGKERKIFWLRQQEAMLEGYKTQKLQKDKAEGKECDPEAQRQDAIVVTRKLTNPSGRNWDSFSKSNEELDKMRDHAKVKGKGTFNSLSNNPLNTWTNAPINQDTQVKQNAKRDDKGNGSFDNPQLRGSTPADKESLNQLSHKTPIEQTQYNQSGVLAWENTHATSGPLSPSSVDTGQFNQFSHTQSMEQVLTTQDGMSIQANYLIESDQLPPNSHLSDNEKLTALTINPRDYPLELKEARGITRGQSRVRAPQTKEYLSPHYSKATSNGYPIKKSVHFKDSMDRQGRSYDLKGYDPILITPRPSYPEYSGNGPDRPKGTISPKPWLDGEGRYFSGTVENGLGGDFHGYYFAPTPPSNPTAKEHCVTTSTPHINDNYSDKSLPSRRIESIVP